MKQNNQYFFSVNGTDTIQYWIKPIGGSIFEHVKVATFKMKSMKYLVNPERSLRLLIIQETLLNLKGNDFLCMSLKNAAKDNIEGCVNLVVDCYDDAPDDIEKSIGWEIIHLCKTLNS